MSRYYNDGGGEAPQLRCFLNTDNLTALPGDSLWPGLAGAEALERLREDGFEGVQIGDPEQFPVPAGNFPFCGLDRINAPEEAEAVFARHRHRGDGCLTLHVGWGWEDDAEVDLLVEAVLTASEKHRLPAFIETHRATITQDMWRTVQLTRRFPEVRFNADFSHYYCGQEMVYGDFDAKLDFLDPVFARTAFIHGRIAAPGYMQAPVEKAASTPRMALGADYLAHFKRMWFRAMAGFKANAGPGDILVFAPELLRPEIHYARVFPDAEGRLREESDRYRQALLYCRIARELFPGARSDA